MPKHILQSHRNIIHNIEPYIKPARFDRLSRGKQFFDFFNGKERRVYLIKEGDFIIRSKNENKIINIITGPFVIGAMPALEAPPIFLEKVDYGKIYCIEYNQFWSLVNHKGLFPDVMKIMSGYHTDLLNCLQSHYANAEVQVTNAISRWSAFPCHIKKRFSVLYFLTNSTFLSKSTACRVLKKLRETGAVRLDKGRLID
ncbi:helix-turn-helix domain-containing protein [Cronobacter dublinensis]|uniref:IprA winged helix-turn-helix domain-containing protein n=1 Tax=Cronobacter dublinensis TaxID=413497 RepID=A0A9Q4T471_9ENTR|nr:helix-turn-helix domain-containing protein [Cronobacter dublinensis]NCH88964.1 hypothetical protein [Cronobacter dublinensis]NHV91123.1 hypothetical protein [Cronobacter dublinensis]